MPDAYPVYGRTDETTNKAAPVSVQALVQGLSFNP